MASKFQTGFDQPLLHTMYVDKKLGGVNAVQTLSRLNRTHPGKDETAVLDFANEADHIREAFEPYYETTILSEATDPNLLYDLQGELLGFHVYTEAEVDAFARVYFGSDATQDQLYAALADPVGRFRDLEPDARSEFRGGLRKYTRLYSFLAQILTFKDADLEKLHVFARYLRQLLPADGNELPREVQQKIDMESYRIQQTGQGGIRLPRGSGTIDPRKTGIQPGGAEEGDRGPVTDHRGTERPLRPQPRTGTPRDPQSNDGQARGRRGARCGRTREHPGERPPHLRSQGSRR